MACQQCQSAPSQPKFLGGFPLLSNQTGIPKRAVYGATFPKSWTNKQAGIWRERGSGGIPLAPFPISNFVKVHQTGESSRINLVPPVVLLVGFRYRMYILVFASL